MFLSILANSNREGRGLADQRTPLLRPVHVRGHPDTDPLLPGRPHLARAPAQQWGDARGRVRGVPPPVERDAVRLLHPRGNTRVHCGVRVGGCQRPTAPALFSLQREGTRALQQGHLFGGLW